MKMARSAPYPGWMYAVVACLAGVAPDAMAGTFNISWDNDLLTASDKGYTNGGRLSYLTDAAEVDDDCSVCLAAHARDGLDWLPGIGAAGDQHALAFSLRQLMFTPENIESSEPQYDDIPYAGYLDGSLTLWSWNDDWITGYGLIVGVVGPDSGARRTQEWVHKLTGSTEPQGWDNQIGQDAVGGLEAYHARRFFRTPAGEGLQNEVSWGAGVTASNFITNAQTGLVWRLGENLPQDFVPLTSGASSTLALPGSTDAPGMGWSVFAGVGGQWVPYSYMDHHADPYTYDQNPFIWQAGVGAGWHWNGFQATLILRGTSSPDKTNKDELTFGTLAATWSW